jgi:predicted PurR-regulated permease PerM
MKAKRILLAILKRMSTSYGKLFLVVISIFSLLFIAYLFYAGHTLRSSQERIKDYYTEHINKIDSMYCGISKYNLAWITETKKISDAVLADSLVKYTLGRTKILSKAQYQNLVTVISEHFKHVDQLQEWHKTKLLQDSIRLNAERVLLEGQIKNMVDLHLNKIEHEYNNITLWAAILTILFLVFSFYSIYKMDELIQQGRDGVLDIKQLKSDGEERIKDIAADLRRQNAAYTRQLKKSLSDQSKEILENSMADGRTILQEYDEKMRSRILEFEEQQKLLVEIVNVFRNSINDIKKQKGDSSNG